MHPTPQLASLAFRVWDTRYRWRHHGEPRDATIADTWRRVAGALAAAEPRDAAAWAARFLQALADFRFLPGGRVLAGAGTGERVTLFNCFVMGRLDDSIEGIFGALQESALTMQQGGGIGLDFSTLRPRGTAADTTGGVASGPVSFMHVWDSMCATLLATSARRGAMMATLACDHPDIEAFVDAKARPDALRRFNLSVLVSDAFLAAVRDDAEWILRFPCAGRGPARVPTLPVQRAVSARSLWERILRANYAYAEPGVLFIDRIARENNLAGVESIVATNPCGEVPLPAYGACDLGSLNLTTFVTAPFTPHAAIDHAALADATAVATRMLDDVYEVSGFPLSAQREAARQSRRLGLGITGLADALVMLDLRYDTPAARRAAGAAMRTVRDAAYRASVTLAQERGAFPAFDAERHLRGAFVRRLPDDVRAGIERDGLRNSHLLAIAPTGSISLLAGNVSSGIEPVFAAAVRRLLRTRDGQEVAEHAVDYAVARYRALGGAEALPPAFVAAADVAPAAQLAMQAALQEYVDNAISKTVFVPESCAFEAFRDIFDRAYGLGLKGCTTFRPNPVTGAVLASDVDACCTVGEEG